MLALYVWTKSRLTSEEGQDLVEYALLVALIALVCIIAVTAGGQAISQVWWGRIIEALNDAGLGAGS